MFITRTNVLNHQPTIGKGENTFLAKQASVSENSEDCYNRNGITALRVSKYLMWFTI